MLDAVDQLNSRCEALQRENAALLYDMVNVVPIELCDACLNARNAAPCADVDFSCENCTEDCPCKECWKDRSHFVHRGPCKENMKEIT